MVRVLASLLLVLTLPACGIAPPSSVFASFANYEQPPVTKTEPRKPEPEREGGLSSSIGNIWDSVKAGIGFDTTVRTTAADNTPVQALDAEKAERLINTYRAQKGLKPLKLNVKLTQAAAAHAQDLARTDRLSHYGSDGSDAWDRVRRTGYRAHRAAENVGRGQRTLEEILRGWETSRDHNANLLLTDAEEMGIALAFNADTQFKTYWALVLGSEH